MVKKDLVGLLTAGTALLGASFAGAEERVVIQKDIGVYGSGAAVSYSALPVNGNLDANVALGHRINHANGKGRYRGQGNPLETAKCSVGDEPFMASVPVAFEDGSVRNASMVLCSNPKAVCNNGNPIHIRYGVGDDRVVTDNQGNVIRYMNRDQLLRAVELSPIPSYDIVINGVNTGSIPAIDYNNEELNKAFARCNNTHVALVPNLSPAAIAFLDGGGDGVLGAGTSTGPDRGTNSEGTGSNTN